MLRARSIQTNIMFRNFLLVAWRNIIRHKGYAAIHVIGLGVGICACMAIWEIGHYQLSFDKFHPDKDRIFRLVWNFKNTNGNSGEVNHWGDVPEPTIGEARKIVTGVETFAQFHNINPLIEIPGQHGQIKKIPKVEGEVLNDVVFAEPQYFDIFKYRWLAGNAASLNEPFHVVLTAKEVERYFGKQDYNDVLGRPLIYDDTVHVTVTGIVQDFDQVTDFAFKDFISYSTIRAAGLTGDLALDSWGSFNSSSETFVKLQKGVTASRIEAQLKGLASRIITNPKAEPHIGLQPLADLHYSTDYDKDYGSRADLKSLYRLMAVAIFILMLASINFVNLSTAQSLRRAKEIGIRKVLGSRRMGLVVQFMSETLLLAVMAMVLSLLLLRPLMSALPDWVPDGLTVNLLDPATILVGIGIVAAAALLSGLYPALVLSSFQPAQTLKGQSRVRRSWVNVLAKGLVVFQFTISAGFIIAAIVMKDQMYLMLHKDMGFKGDAIIRMDAGQKDTYAKRKLLAERIRAIPGVVQAGMDMAMPIMHGASKTSTSDKASGISYSANFRAADTNYFSMYQIPLIAGRNFVDVDTPREVVINEMMSKELGYKRPQDALGHVLPFGDNNKLTIVGVVADFNQRSLQYGIEPTMIVPVQDFETGFSVKLPIQAMNAAAIQRTIAAIGKQWAEVFPDEPFRYEWVDRNIAKIYSAEAQTSEKINLAMIITIVVSGMGLFGLAALSAGQRTREIGIRKVLGAGVVNITAMITRDFVLLVGLALVIASPLAWYFMHDWLQDYVYRVSIGWWVFGLAAVFAVGIAVITVGFHAVRAAVVNPVKSLRRE